MEKLMDLGHMDNYYEQIVKKKFAANQLATLVMGICSIVLVIFLCVYFSAVIPLLVPVSLIALGVGVWLIYTLVKNSGVEYEYTFVMGEMRIERIKGNTVAWNQLIQNGDFANGTTKRNGFLLC